MAEWKVFFLVLCLHSFTHYSHGTPSWDQLRVTFGKFTVWPVTTKQAREAGWKKDASCSGYGNFFYGNRYVKEDDDATRLIFDCDGSLAGMQATINRTDTYPPRQNQSPWISTRDGRVAVTAYFCDPRKICVCEGKEKKHMAQKPPIGDRLWLQMADVHFQNNFLKIPLNKDQIDRTPWVEGTCYPAMGDHYHYNISVDFDCDQALPIFLLISQETKSLIGFAWAGPFDVQSDAWEKPIPSLFWLSMKPETAPDCVKNYTDVSVQHVYFVDPLNLACA